MACDVHHLSERAHAEDGLSLPIVVFLDTFPDSVSHP